MLRKLELVHNVPNPAMVNLTKDCPAASRAAWLNSVLKDEDRHDANAASLSTSGVCGGFRVLLLGFPYGSLSQIKQRVKATGVMATASASNVEQLSDVAYMGLGLTHVVVNLDAFEDLAAGIDALIEFREDAPDIGVILLSERVGGDDFGSERSAICDATLKLPATTPRLAAGLLAASQSQRKIS